MNHKILIALFVGVSLLIAGAFVAMLLQGREDVQRAVMYPSGMPSDENGRRMAPPALEEPGGKLKVANFSGTLQEVSTGCFADGECYVVVGGKHITTIMGWREAKELGSIIGVESFGDLESHIGEEVEVYAKDNGDGTYTLYGSSGFYVQLKK